MATTGRTEWTCDVPLCAGAGETNDSTPPVGWVRVGDKIVCPLQNSMTLGALKTALGIV